MAWPYRAAAATGTCARKNVRACSIVLAFSSGGSRQGNAVDCAFGAKAATSSEARKGWDGVSSGITSIGVGHERANSRDTL